MENLYALKDSFYVETLSALLTLCEVNPWDANGR